MFLVFFWCFGWGDFFLIFSIFSKIFMIPHSTEFGLKNGKKQKNCDITWHGGLKIEKNSLFKLSIEKCKNDISNAFLRLLMHNYGVWDEKFAYNMCTVGPDLKKGALFQNFS